MINRFIILKKIVKNLVWQYFFPIYFSITRGWRALRTPNLYYVIYGQPLTSLGIILLKQLFWLLSLVVLFATLEACPRGGVSAWRHVLLEACPLERWLPTRDEEGEERAMEKYKTNKYKIQVVVCISRLSCAALGSWWPTHVCQLFRMILLCAIRSRGGSHVLLHIFLQNSAAIYFANRWHLRRLLFYAFEIELNTYSGMCCDWSFK